MYRIAFKFNDKWVAIDSSSKELKSTINYIKNNFFRKVLVSKV